MTEAAKNTAKWVATTAVVVVVGGLLWWYLTYDPGDQNEASAGLDGSGSLQDVAKTEANRLHAAMNKPGTDYDIVLDVFNGIDTNERFAAIKNAFGVRPYENFVVGLPDWLYKHYNLEEWLNEEYAVDTEELNEILESNGVTYKV